MYFGENNNSNVLKSLNVAHVITKTLYLFSAFGPELAYRLRVAQPTLMDVTRYF